MLPELLLPAAAVWALTQSPIPMEVVVATCEIEQPRFRVTKPRDQSHCLVGPGIISNALNEH